MIEQVFDNFLKASESTMRLQQEMLKQWTTQWGNSQWAAPWTSSSPAPGLPGSSAWAEGVQSFQKRWLETLSDLMNKHRESLDSQYRAGIRAIEEAIRTTEVKTPEDFRRVSEELWRKGFENLRNASEAQMRDFQAAMEKWFELLGKAKV